MEKSRNQLSVDGWQRPFNGEILSCQQMEWEQSDIDMPKKELWPSPPSSHPGYLEMDSNPECPAMALLDRNLQQPL